MTLYTELNIKPVINAAATLTRLGGSRMPPEVLDAMREAAAWFVDLDELQTKIGAELARLTHNEAAYVATGAAAGIALAVAACVTGQDSAARLRLPDTGGREVIVFKSHRNGYDYAIRMVGVKLVEVEGDIEDLEAAFTDRTAAFVWFQGAMTGRGDLPLAQVLERCRAHTVPVIVDAAAQLPPVENLWAFTQQGAAGAVFSGGKELCGPQASGLVVGQSWLIDAMRPNGSPNASFGRPMKVGKEEMAGLLAAVRRYLTLDHTARRQRDEGIVAEWCRALGTLPGVLAQRSFPNEAGQPSPRCEVRLTAQAKVTLAQLIQTLWAGSPAVAVGEGEGCIYLNPMTVTDEEAAVVLERVREALT